MHRPCALASIVLTGLLALAGAGPARSGGPAGDESGMRRIGTAGAATLDPPAELSVARFRPHVVLRWTHTGRGAAGFQIERAEALGVYARIGTASGDARTFRDRSARPDRSYTYRVRAIAPGAASAYSKEVLVAVTRKRHGGPSPGGGGSRASAARGRGASPSPPSALSARWPG